MKCLFSKRNGQEAKSVLVLLMLLSLVPVDPERRDDMWEGTMKRELELESLSPSCDFENSSA